MNVGKYDREIQCFPGTWPASTVLLQGSCASENRALICIDFLWCICGWIASRCLGESRQQWPKAVAILLAPSPPAPWRNPCIFIRHSMCLKESDGFSHENSHLCRQPSASALGNQLTRYCSLVLLSLLSDWIFLVACWSWVALTHRNHHWEHLFSTWCSLISDSLKPASEGVLTNDGSSPKKGLVVRYLLVHLWSYPTDPISPDLTGTLNHLSISANQCHLLCMLRLDSFGSFTS